MTANDCLSHLAVLIGNIQCPINYMNIPSHVGHYLPVGCEYSSVSSRLYGHFGGETSAIQPQKFHTDGIDLSRIW